MQLLAKQIVNPFETLTHADRPGKWRTLDLQLVLDIIQNVERRQALAVHFVDERHDRGIPHPADLHQFFGLRFDPFGIVDHHQAAVDGG